ncbi:M56 family metallopeptidase [Pirellulaceae bacterium SH467]
MHWIETVNTYLPALKFVTAVVVPFAIPVFAEVFSRRFSADLRCKLWLFAMFSMCAAPILYRIDVPWPVAFKPSAPAAGSLSDRDDESLYASPSGSLPRFEGQPGTEHHQTPTALLETPKSTKATESKINPASNSSRTFSWSNLYLGFACVLLCRLLYTHWRAFLFRSRSEPIENVGSHSLLQEWSRRYSITIRASGDIQVPTVVGLIRPVILLPKDTESWPADKLMAVVQHESAHISRGDIFWTTVAYVLRAAFWINPLAWIAVARITRLRELACDDIASKQAINAFSYAEHLIAIARELGVTREKSDLIASTASAIQQTELTLRLRYILDARQSRVPSSVTSTMVFAAAFGSLAAFCGAFLPSSFTATLLASDEPPVAKSTQGAVLFSGHIKDARGTPIAGVRLSPGVFDIKLNEQDRLDSEMTTNEEGYFEWRTPMVYRLHLSKYGYLSQQIEVNGPRERQIVMRDAYKIRGVVLGADSKPVIGAKVSVFIDADGAQPPRKVLTTDTKGNFEFASASSSVMNIAAIDDDGQAGTLSNASSTNSNNTIQLLPPKNVTIRVKDHTGNPVADADIILGSWNKSGVRQFTDKTNSEGEVVWPKAPSGRLVFAARRQGFRTGWTIVDSQTSATAEITLYPPLKFSCTAVDDETGESIQDFIVTRRYERKVSWYFGDEKFDDVSLNERFRSRGMIGDQSKDGLLSFVSDYAFDRMILQVHANGYQTLEDIVVSDADVSPQRNYRLTKVKHDTGTEIQVVGPDGMPASNVNVELQRTGQGSGLRFDPDDILLDRLRNPGLYLPGTYTKTGSNGKFVLPAEPKIGSIVVWGDSGCYFGSLSDMDPAKPVVLKPYSRVRIRLPLNMRQNKLANFILKKEVKVLYNGTPIPNSLSIQVNPTRGDIPDEIVVERALGGTISLVDWAMRPNQRLITENVLASFEVEPGFEVLVDLTGTSKISGKLSLPKEAKVRLEQLEIRATTQGKDHAKTYSSFVQSDGYFEFDEISAGDYTFTIPAIEVEPPEGMPRPSPYDISTLHFGIDIQESIAEGQSRDIGVVETKILKQLPRAAYGKSRNE